jgi:hypothetical protein
MMAMAMAMAIDGNSSIAIEVVGETEKFVNTRHIP